jgi:hypothetical protein
MKPGLIAMGITAILLASPANADSEGNPGIIAGMRLVNLKSDEFAKFHGGVSVDEGNGVVTEYFWGGNHCPGIDSEIHVVAHMSRALGNDRLRMKPLYKPGAGGTPCLTEALIVDKKYVDTVPAFP